MVTAPAEQRGLSAGLVRLLAAAIAVTVANLYYAQPLLASLATGFGVSTAAAGLVVATAQVGYALGLVFLVPVRDIARPRLLLVTLSGCNAAALAASAAAPSAMLLAVIAVLVGLASVSVTMLVAHAATLATNDQRARVVGTLLGGLLVGVLVARAFAGVLADVAGWRGVYAAAAGLMVAVAVTLHRRLPAGPRELSVGYVAQLRGVLLVVRTQPVLRWRSLNGGCGFAAFGCFWTTVTFLLAERYDLSQLQIGLFAVLGVAGAASATLAGRFLAARPRRQRWPVTAVIGGLLVASFPLLWLGGTHLVWLIVGVVVMDAAMQALNAVNQAVVYDLLPEARSRISTVYATTMFVGGAAGSALGAQAYGRFGWSGATTTAAACALAVLAAVAGSRQGEQALSDPQTDASLTRDREPSGIPGPTRTS